MDKETFINEIRNLLICQAHQDYKIRILKTNLRQQASIIQRIAKATGLKLSKEEIASVIGIWEISPEYALQIINK